MTTLPGQIYTREQVIKLDEIAMTSYGQTDLMERAGAAALNYCTSLWPHAESLLVFCGKGNNGGDGFVVAKLAKARGLKVLVVMLESPEDISGEAEVHYKQCVAKKVEITSWPDFLEMRILNEYDVIIDALLGTGATGEVKGIYEGAIEWINKAMMQVLSVDIPSGLDANTGRPLGMAVCADATITFVGVKKGLLLSEGPDFSGELLYSDLDIPRAVFSEIAPHYVRLSTRSLLERFELRASDVHKGLFGHVVVIGGNVGMAGAVGLAALAAIRAGAGRVSVVTHPKNQAIVHGFAPELMCYGAESFAEVRDKIDLADVVVMGPGLGQDSWGQQWFQAIDKIEQPLVLDADGLNLLSQATSIPVKLNWIMTPHPGEAAKLLGTDTKTIQADRDKSVRDIADKYHAHVVLKGAGTLIHNSQSPVYFCDAGNPGMATGGMGDVLTGVIAALIAQKDSLIDAARIGTVIHAVAGDIAAADGERGMIASDLLGPIRDVVNPQYHEEYWNE